MSRRYAGRVRNSQILKIAKAMDRMYSQLEGFDEELATIADTNDTPQIRNALGALGDVIDELEHATSVMYGATGDPSYGID